MGLCSCTLKNAFEKIKPDSDGYSRSKTYTKVMQIVAERDDLGLDDKERTEFIVSTTIIFDLVHALRACKSEDPAACLCTCGYH